MTKLETTMVLSIAGLMVFFVAGQLASEASRVRLKVTLDSEVETRAVNQILLGYPVRY
jgi:hypothetical protein